VHLRNNIIRVLVLAFGAGALALAGTWFPVSADDGYVGSDVCFDCHPTQWNEWTVSGHPYKLQKAEIAKQRPIPLPEGISWDDVSYVIGGYKWKSRYVGADGYIITTVATDSGPVAGMTQYHNLTGEWVDYHPGELKPCRKVTMTVCPASTALGRSAAFSVKSATARSSISGRTSRPDRSSTRPRRHAGSVTFVEN